MASEINSYKNSAALPGFSFPQKIPTTNGSRASTFLTKHRIGHMLVVELRNKGIPSTFI